jgi:hypothetical protein
MAFQRGLNALKIQMAIPISASPMSKVKVLEWLAPNILATICSWRGTRLSTLQNSPLAIQTIAMQ